MSIVPAPENQGICAPKAIASTAPNDAPLDTPNVEPSARGFRSIPCMAAPQRDSAAPVNATQSTLGSRTETIIARDTSSGEAALPVTEPQMFLKTSDTGTVTLPKQMHSTKTVVVTSSITAYSAVLNFSDLLAIEEFAQSLGGINKPRTRSGYFIGIDRYYLAG